MIYLSSFCTEISVLSAKKGIMSNSKKEFVLTWRVENFGYLWKRYGDYISSPPFTVKMLAETRWTLRLKSGKTIPTFDSGPL
ncbi:hypothetical protein CEXT_295711 [Caerostris extrusa]|uniref:MATH domain-containing protein n=1 Tax=Caerostris extrusa TaxID=172846 RepID=A0AAV4M5A8_CAEEX|nr:hypothetical protein CEXT_295711 [Caerostris extrusa]